MTDEKPLVPVQGIPEDLDAFHVAVGAYGGQPRAEQGKPLHVRVAEALGWTECAPWASEHRLSDRWSGVWPGSTQRTQYAPHGLVRTIVPKFDVDWAATGPLIERFVSYIEKLSDEGTATMYGARWWSPEFGEMDDIIETGPTILVAVCNLIVALHEAGRLPR